MKKLKGKDIVLKVLGLVLIVAAVLKGHELLTVPVTGKDLWSWRPFLIFQVEFELALAIWLLSGLLKKAAWLVTLLCFSLFSAITFYKALTGAESCGCFGSVHVNPWITLFANDLSNRPLSCCGHLAMMNLVMKKDAKRLLIALSDT